jgi:hypothetical protein
VLHLNWPFAMSVLASQQLAPTPIRAAPLPTGPHGRATVLARRLSRDPAPRAAPRSGPAARSLLLSREGAAGSDARSAGSRRAAAAPGAGNALLAGFAAMRGDVRPRPERADYPALSRAWQEAFRAVVFAGEKPEVALAAARDRVQDSAAR